MDEINANQNSSMISKRASQINLDRVAFTTKKAAEMLNRTILLSSAGSMGGFKSRKRKDDFLQSTLSFCSI